MSRATTLTTRFVRTALIGALLLADCASAADRPADATFARVGEARVTQQDYETAVTQAARGKFYHGKAPDAEVQTLRSEVGERLVNDILLMEEAKRRGIAPDVAGVEKRLAALDARYADNPKWQEQRADTLPRLKRKLEDESLVVQLEAAVRAAVSPSAKEVEQYYTQHADRFTEPEQFKASIILIKVDPSSPRAEWDKAREKVAALLAELRAGKDFAELARSSSQDPSAADGGDLGYLHRGMVPEPAEQALDRLQPGQLSEPVTLLEGIAILRLDQRTTSRLQPFADAKAAATEFVRREQGEAAWQELVVALRRDKPPVFEDPSFVPLARLNGAPAAAASQ